ncbi:CopG family ribbon-helix-helix protein [Hellea balneolensis]|uniref:CopG family ribbon-helix-helix protein n=1 Tax=Hellea balneolensis TaxID=287478 RepID=UPI0003FEC048|nr:ribbon-helix-helix protein, CopG family [Hellea balneolensis]
MSTQSTTLSIRIPVSVKEDLAELSQLTGRSQSALAAHAIELYVNRELDICRKLQEGLDDIKAGRTVPHEEVMAKAKAIIDSKYATRKMG